MNRFIHKRSKGARSCLDCARQTASLAGSNPVYAFGSENAAGNNHADMEQDCQAGRLLLPRDGTHCSLLNLRLRMVIFGMPNCQLAGSVPVKPLPDRCSVCRAGSRLHASGSVPAVCHVSVSMLKFLQHNSCCVSAHACISSLLWHSFKCTGLMRRRPGMPVLCYQGENL